MLNLWEEASRIHLFGVDLYAFGVYCAIGAAAAALVLAVLGRFWSLKPGSAGVITLMALLCGAVCSRVGFCLMNQSLGKLMPIASWFRITEGGWSLAGMIGGAFLGGWLASRMLKESGLAVFDAVACALPLMIAAEKLGESHIPDFDVSRAMAGANAGFWTVTDEYGAYLATFRLGAVMAMALFLVLTFCLVRKERREGDQGILFLLLAGAGGVLLESLRYDHFLEFSFVRFQQVLYAVMLVVGVAMAARRNRARVGWRRAAWISVVAAIALCVGIEFALDRTSISHILLYAAMIVALGVPVVSGVVLLGKAEK